MTEKPSPLSPIIELPPLTDPDAWEEPVFFGEIETPDIPASLLPGIFGEFAQNLSHAMETPEALSVMILLGVISTIAAKHFKVSPQTGWEEPINIYTLIALPPANHKIIILRQCIQPLIEWEKEQAVLHERSIKKQISERKTQEKIIEALRFKASKIEDSDKQQKMSAEIAVKEADLIEISSLPQLFVNDVTPESLATLLYEQHGRLAIFSDEGGILETLAGLYSNGVANVDILLKGIDGGEIRVRRKDKSLILNPYLTIVLAVQPAIIQNLAQKKAYKGNGTLERFLYVIPKSKLGYRTHDKPAVSTQIQFLYNQKVLNLLNECSSRKDQPASLLKLSPEAYQRWKSFQATIEIQLRPHQRLSYCQGWGGKICGFALRIAGLLHIAEYGLSGNRIGETTMDKAIQIAELLIEHAIAAFGWIGIDQTTEDAKEVWHWITAQKQNSFRQSDLLLAMRGRKLGRSERLKKALVILQEHHLISEAVKLPTRKPTTIYHIHPSADASH